jgi:hypothetical protein
MAACPVCKRSFSLGFLWRKLFGVSRDPWAALSCPHCGAALRPKRGWLFVVNFSSMLAAILLMQAASARGISFGMRLIGFAAILILLRIVLTPLLLRFNPREEEDGARKNG